MESLWYGIVQDVSHNIQRDTNLAGAQNNLNMTSKREKQIQLSGANAKKKWIPFAQFVKVDIAGG